MLWFGKKTLEDPVFGNLTQRRGSWVGSTATPLFPEKQVAIVLQTKQEEALNAFRAHCQHVGELAEEIRRDIAAEALKTYQLYAKEDDTDGPYPRLSSANEAWDLINPCQWHFIHDAGEFQSRLDLEFAWPNPHSLGAYLGAEGLIHLEVQG